MYTMRVFVFLLLASIVAASSDEVRLRWTVGQDLMRCSDLPRGETPTEDCCNGIRMIKKEGESVSDYKHVCLIVQDIIKAWTPERIQFVASCPEQCGVDYPYKIDPSTDCNSLETLY